MCRARIEEVEHSTGFMLSAADKADLKANDHKNQVVQLLTLDTKAKQLAENLVREEELEFLLHAVQAQSSQHEDLTAQYSALRL